MKSINPVVGEESWIQTQAEQSILRAGKYIQFA
jgi:hypothetical protein